MKISLDDVLMGIIILLGACLTAGFLYAISNMSSEDKDELLQIMQSTQSF